jgi:hypothetical protein
MGGRKQKSYRRVWVFLLLCGVIAVVVYHWPHEKGSMEINKAPGLEMTQEEERERIAPARTIEDEELTPVPADKPKPAPKPAPAPKPVSGSKAASQLVGPKGITRALASGIGASPLTTAPVSADKAAECYAQGVAEYAKEDRDLLLARTLLNQAYLANTLSPGQQDQVRQLLQDLASKTVLRRGSYINHKDPYVISYTFAAGDRLLSIRNEQGTVTKKGLIAANELNVPYRVIVYANGLNSSTEFREGRRYKLLKGPFHLVVDKKQRVADLYLQNLFVKRMKVGIGAADTPTPTGYFRVVQGGKTKNSPYQSPSEMGALQASILPGEPNYPLDAQGHNMKIEGILALGTDIDASQGYALHGTNESDTIGKMGSMGCLRFSDKDIQLLYGSLQDYASPNDPHATWTRWSTITIR